MANGDDGNLVHDPNAVAAARDRIESAATALQGAVDDLSAQVQQLASSWTDEEAKGQYDGAHKKVSDGLDSMSTTLGQVLGAFDQNIELVAGMRNKVTQLTSGG